MKRIFKKIALVACIASAFVFTSCASLSGNVTIADGIVNGSVTADKTEGVLSSSTVTLIVTPDAGYDLDTITVTTVEKGETVDVFNNTFEMPSGDVTVTASFKQPAETKSKPDAVGDVVLNDGTAVAYENISKMTATQKAKAIAVIFYVGTECSNNGETRMLGVGFMHEYASWQKASDENQNQSSLGKGISFTMNTNPKIDTIACKVKANTVDNFYGQQKLFAVASNLQFITDSYEFSGDKDGSDNLEQIASFLKKSGKTDDTTPVAGASTYKDQNYPAFYFAKDYKDYLVDYITTDKSSSFDIGSIIGGRKEKRVFRDTHLGDIYKDNWYLPTIVELFQIWKNKDIVDAASVLCGGDKFDEGDNKSLYVSSSQFEELIIDGTDIKPIGGGDSLTFVLNFASGECSSEEKNGSRRSYHACAIREF